MRTRQITAYLIAVIIFWWTASNSTTLLLQTAIDDRYATSDVTSNNNSNRTITGSENYLNLEAPKHCHRKCNTYNQSKIFYADSGGGGLDDRIRLINAMINLASFLCADLYILVSKIPFSNTSKVVP